MGHICDDKQAESVSDRENVSGFARRSHEELNLACFLMRLTGSTSDMRDYCKKVVCPGHHCSQTMT